MSLTQAYRIEGLDCAEEVAILKRAVGPLVDGEEHLAFDVLRGKMTVLGSAPTGIEEDILEAVAGTGMRALPWDQAASEREEGFWRRHGKGALTLASGALTLTGFGLHAMLAGGLAAALVDGGAVPWPVRAVYLAGIVAGGWHILPKAWCALRRLRPDMNLLMTVAVVGAAGIGQWLEAATVTFLFAVSNALESWSVGRARRAVEALMDLSPATVRLVTADGEKVVLAETVQVNTVFVVQPGERIPLDGEVIAGTSEVDQAPITGESVPVPKGLSEEVFAGTINGDGALEVRSSRSSGDTTLARIIRLVEQAQSRRAPSEQWVERFARIYTPAIIALAAAVLLVPPLLFGGAWSVWFYRALVLLVIGCPCALVISTPVSVVAALASAARHGVLIKGGVFVEAPAALRAIAFDKTGTLTRGEPEVVEVVPLAGHDEAGLLERAAALEVRSNHPVARAIVAFAGARGLAVRPADNLQSLQGRGAVGEIDGTRYWLGSHRFLEEQGKETPEIHDRLEGMASTGRTVVVVGHDGHVCGLIALSDRIRPEARAAIAQLRRLGIEHLVMLTGDNRPTAEAIAREAGIDEVESELLPADKVAAVQTLVARYGKVAMAGDGVNDAPAMARATVGIAMGAVGSDAAVETGDIALMSDDLSRLPWLIGHSRRTLRVIRQNIVFALGVKAAVFLLATLGFASLWMAIAADMGASLLVIFNGLRLLHE